MKIGKTITIDTELNEKIEDMVGQNNSFSEICNFIFIKYFKELGKATILKCKDCNLTYPSTVDKCPNCEELKILKAEQAERLKQEELKIKELQEAENLKSQSAEQLEKEIENIDKKLAFINSRIDIIEKDDTLNQDEKENRTKNLNLSISEMELAKIKIQDRIRELENPDKAENILKEL